MKKCPQCLQSMRLEGNQWVCHNCVCAQKPIPDPGYCLDHDLYHGEERCPVCVQEQKQEQTEPVDFSSNTSAYTYTTTSASTMVAGSFSTTESGNSSTTDTLNRYRSANPVAGYSSLGLSASTGPSGYSTYSSGYASYPQASYSGYSSTFGMNPAAAAAGYDQDPLNSYGFVSGLTAAAAAISASSGGSGELPLKTDLLPSVSR